MANPVWCLSGYVCHCYQSRKDGWSLPILLSPLPESTPQYSLHNAVFLWTPQFAVKVRTYNMLNYMHFIPSLVYPNDKKPAEYISTIWNPPARSKTDGFEDYFHLLLHSPSMDTSAHTPRISKITCLPFITVPPQL